MIQSSLMNTVIVHMSKIVFWHWLLKLNFDWPFGPLGVLLI
jgi:hypothetical protein